MRDAEQATCVRPHRGAVKVKDVQSHDLLKGKDWIQAYGERVNVFCHQPHVNFMFFYFLVSLSECLVIATEAKVPTSIYWARVWVSAVSAHYGFREPVDEYSSERLP